MSVTLFPMIQPQSAQGTNELKLCREVRWDFQNNVPVFQNGEPLFVTGKEAVLVWAKKALHTQRFRYEIYTWAYGCEMESLIGQPFTGDLKQAEAARYVTECLLINPYITGVSNIEVNFEDGRLTVGCRISTIYGEAEINV